MQHRGVDHSDSAKTALQTVAAGQVAENLLDFDDEPAQDGSTGLAATQVLQEPAAKNILSGTLTNPLDDLVSIFGNTSLSPSALIPAAAAAPAIDPLGAFGGFLLRRRRPGHLRTRINRRISWGCFRQGSTTL